MTLLEGVMAEKAMDLNNISVENGRYYFEVEHGRNDSKPGNSMQLLMGEKIIGI